MGKAILFHADGKLPNLALMRISARHKSLGDEVELRKSRSRGKLLWDSGDEKVYCSIIFEKTRSFGEEVLRDWPDAIIGGTGWDTSFSLEDIGITQEVPDYDLYPKYPHSIGFTQRGCRLKCKFCVVPIKEGDIRAVQTINDIWRGEGHPKEIVLLDNDFFGQPQWRERIDEIQAGKFKVSFCQGINVRFIDDESAKAIASVDYRDSQMKRKCIYTAWDNQKDEKRVMAGLETLVKHGIKPYHIMVYMLIGYWPNETIEDCLYRVRKLREFGADPYPMPFIRTKETVGLQRWVCGHYDKRIEWSDWVAADYLPRRLGKSS